MKIDKKVVRVRKVVVQLLVSSMGNLSFGQSYDPGISDGIEDEGQNLCVSHILSCICDVFEGIEASEGAAGTGYLGSLQNVLQF